MSDLYDTIRQIVRQELRALRTAELAVVQEQHPHAGESDTDNYACTVVLRNSQLVLPRVPVATSRIGHAAIPNVGDLVLVQFIAGDINAPVITGSFYHDEERPPPNDDGQLVWHLPAAGGKVQLLVDGKESAISLLLGNGLEIKLADGDPAIQIEAGGGSATIQIDSDGTVTISSQRAVSIEATSELNLKAANISIKADGQLELKGGLVKIN